jgi:hypothetical protein
MESETKLVLSRINTLIWDVPLKVPSFSIFRRLGQKSRRTSRFAIALCWRHSLMRVSSQNIQNDTGKLAMSVAKERELSTRYIADLTISVSSYKNTPMAVTPRGDP